MSKPLCPAITAACSSAHITMHTAVTATEHTTPAMMTCPLSSHAAAAPSRNTRK